MPPGLLLPREEALATLARRYVVSHGPVTIQDFVWWSGLSVAEAKQGLAAVEHQLETVTIGEQRYFFAGTTALPERPMPFGALLPPFDEFLIAYRDRSAILDPAYSAMVVPASPEHYRAPAAVDEDERRMTRAGAGFRHSSFVVRLTDRVNISYKSYHLA